VRPSIGGASASKVSPHSSGAAGSRMTVTARAPASSAPPRTRVAATGPTAPSAVIADQSPSVKLSSTDRRCPGSKRPPEAASARFGAPGVGANETVDPVASGRRPTLRSRATRGADQRSVSTRSPRAQQMQRIVASEAVGQNRGLHPEKRPRRQRTRGQRARAGAPDRRRRARTHRGTRIRRP
jgi:hypothetical protein